MPEFDLEDLREVIFERYLIVYFVKGDTVTIYSVLHSSMDLADRLAGLKKKPS